MKTFFQKIFLLGVMTFLTLGASATPDRNYLCFTANESNSTVGLWMNGTDPYPTSLEYSLDGNDWSNYTLDTNIALNHAGDKVYFRYAEEGPTDFLSWSDYYYSFKMTGSIAASGNIMSLINKSCEGEWVYKYCFKCLFEGCEALTSAPELPGMALGENCYEKMFKGCINLATAPELPATILAMSCYRYMFKGCINLTTPPVLPATTLAEYCYEEMFYGCTNLMTAPALPATTLAKYCYYSMFYGCEKLTTAPALPATTLANGCYNAMFRDCSKLNKVEVGFTDWGEGSTFNWLEGVASTGDFICPKGLNKKCGTSYIPEGWTFNGSFPYLNFTANAPSSRVQLNMVGGESTGLALEYSTDECQTWTPYTITYDADTNGSIGLPITLANAGDKVYFRKSGDGVATAFSASDNSYYRFSVYGSVAADGNIMSLIDKYAETTTIPGAYCFAHLFESCTGLTTAPQLPATTLKPYCYASMFSGCTGLTSAPALPATTLEKDCYNKMFYYCTKLNEIKVGFTDWTVTVNEKEYTPTKDWLYNVSSDGVFTSHAGLDRTQRDASHIPAGWMAMNYRYVVTANSADESKGTVSGGGTYEEGTEVTLTAAPAEGCVFKQWSDGTTANPYVFTATKDVTLTAQFAKLYTVQVASADESKGTVSGGGTYAEGDLVTLTATPAEYYKFEKWSDGSTANPYVFTAEKDVELTATFSKITYTIMVVSEDESYGTVTGGGTYEAGEEVTVTATPAEGYEFFEWMPDGTMDNPYTFTVTKNTTLKGLFSKLPWDFEEDGILYSKKTDEEVYVFNKSYKGNMVIPETVTHNGKTYRVTGLDPYAFVNCSDLTSVMLPNGIKTIGFKAFFNCVDLTKVIMGTGVEVVEENAFENCPKLEDVYFGGFYPPSFEGTSAVFDDNVKIHIPIISSGPAYGTAINRYKVANIVNDVNVYSLQISPYDAAVTIKGKQYGNGDFVGPIDGSLSNPCGTALQVSDVKDAGMFGYDLSVSYNDGYFKAEYTPSTSPVFTDATPYSLPEEKTFPELTYSRTFTNTNWQPLYVPFAMSYSEWKDNFDVAAINNFHEYTDADGKTVKTELEVRLVKSGKLKPNHPYLIKAHIADDKNSQEINISSKKMYKSEENSIVCSSVERKYTFTGTYQDVTGMKTKDYIFMSGGKLCKAVDDGVKLSPQRWYLKIESLGSQVDGGNTSNAKAMEFDIKLLDDEATGIDEITVTRTPLRNSVEAIYNLNGMRVNDSYKGIVIKNGKKVLQK